MIFRCFSMFFLPKTPVLPDVLAPPRLPGVGCRMPGLAKAQVTKEAALAEVATRPRKVWSLRKGERKT